MAYVNDEWLDYTARGRYLADIKDERDLLVKIMRTDQATEQDMIRLEFLLDEVERVERVHRGEHDVLYFAMNYFSEDGNPVNSDNLIPSGVNYDNAAEFHRVLSGLLNDVARGVLTSHVAWACPRGHAKTAYLSNIFLVHQLVYRHKRYIVLISETTDVAGDFITWARYQLKLNEKLRTDFGEILHLRPSQNELDNKYEFITLSGAKVEAKGLGTQMRGLRHGATRPDLFILDDLESKDSTNTPDLIQKSKSWFREEMLPALSKEGLCVYLGTILCYDSLLDHVIRDRRDFKSRKFAAVKSYAKREDLWRKWREIYREDNENAAENARRFYDENEADMLEGAEILWPGYWSYYRLMVTLEESGIKSFNQEYQNEPTDEERQIFKPEHITYFTDEDLQYKDYDFIGAIDFAMGGERGDYSVIATLARNKDTGVTYLYDLFMERVHPDVLLKKAVELTFEYQYTSLAVEAQQAQAWFADRLITETTKRGFPGHIRIKKIKQKRNKGVRIESLQPDIIGGKIRFRRTQDIDQFLLYPMHKHDDLPDCVAMAYEASKEGYAVVQNTRKRSR